jgi:hypothetical protein
MLLQSLSIEENDFKGIVDLVKMAIVWHDDTQGA